MTSKSLTLCTSLILVFAYEASARQEPTKGQRTPARASVSSAEKGKQQKQSAEEAKQQRKLAVLRVHNFAEQVSSFKDAGTRIMTLAHLANILWKDDETYARQLFTKALDATRVQGDLSSAGSVSLAKLRLEVLALLAQHDPSLAKRLESSAEGVDNDEGGRAKDSAGASNFSANEARTANFKIAYELASTQPERSVEFARRSLRGRVFPYMNVLLLPLRAKNEAATNELFLETLTQLALDPSVDADTLLRLGTYVFTSPRVNARDPNTPPDMTTVAGVANMLGTDITADRPGVPPALIRAYLEAAVSVIMRPLPPPDQRPRLYAAEYLLLPKAERYAPDLVPQIASAMQALTPNVPQELTQDSTYSNFKDSTPKDLDEDLKEIDKDQNEESRNGKYLSLAADYWGRNDFRNARAVASKITDTEARASLETLIDFGEGVRRLEREKDYDGAEKIAARLPQGVESAVLWLAIAHARAKSGASARASEAISSSLAAARKVDDARRPFLILSAASELARVDRVLAQITLAEAVKEFNARKKESLTEVVWEQRVEAGVLWRYFPLRVKGVGFSLEQTLPPLLDADMEGTLASVNNLTGEEEVAQALTTTAAVLLK